MQNILPFPQGAVIFIKVMELHLRWTHELQLHEMILLVIRPIMNPPKLVGLIEPQIHIRATTVRIELNKFGPCPPFAVQLPGIGATSPPMAPSGTARARTSIFRPPSRRTPAARRVFLPYSSTPFMMEASCFSITLWMACTIPTLRNRGPLTQGRVKRGVGARRAHLHVRFIFRTAAGECSYSSVSLPTAVSMARWASP